jgi:hypothetical protein
MCHAGFYILRKCFQKDKLAFVKDNASFLEGNYYEIIMQQ